MKISYNFTKKKENYTFFYKNNNLSKKFFITKEIILLKNNNLSIKIDNFHEILINLRKFIISIIENGFEFDVGKNFSVEEIQKIDNKSIFDFMKFSDSFRKEKFFSLFKIMNTENDILLNDLPRAIKKYNKIKSKNKNYQNKIDILNSKGKKKI